MGEPAPNAGYRGGTRPQRGLSRGNPPPTRAIVGLSRGYCGGTRPQRGLLWGYREVYNILRLT